MKKGKKEQKILNIYYHMKSRLKMFKQFNKYIINKKIQGILKKNMILLGFGGLYNDRGEKIQFVILAQKLQFLSFFLEQHMSGKKLVGEKVK